MIATDRIRVKGLEGATQILKFVNSNGDGHLPSIYKLFTTLLGFIGQRSFHHNYVVNERKPNVFTNPIRTDGTQK